MVTVHGNPFSKQERHIEELPGAGSRFQDAASGWNAAGWKREPFLESDILRDTGTEGNLGFHGLSC